MTNIDKKKCVFLVNTLDSGGIENYLLRFLTHYNGEFYPTVICKGGAYGDLESEYRKIENITLVKKSIGYFDVSGFIGLYKFFRKNSFDSVIDFTGNFGAIPLLMAKYAGIKNRIVFYRGATNHFKENFLRNAYNDILNFIIRKTAVSILSNSQAAFNFFFKNYRDNRFDVIYNGIDSVKFLNSDKNLRDELKIPDSGFVIGHVGRFTEAKNHKTIIATAIKLCKKNKDIYFILCGKDVDKELEGIVKTEKLEDKIKLLGYRKDVIVILNSLDAFYFPSVTEGQPNALLEALIVGLPFVASDIEPIKETIPVKYHEFLLSPQDVDAAANKLNELYTNEKIRKKLDLSVWAKQNYEPGNLFNKFYVRL